MALMTCSRNRDTSMIHCDQGLGNRVAAMANGLSRAREIRFAWVVNAHCPAEAADLFPRGIEGVEFVAGDSGDGFSQWDGRTCERWDAAGDRHAADAAYARIMAAMVGRAQHAAQVAICGRFHRNPAASPETLADAAARHAAGQPIFIFADIHRHRIRTRLATHGIEAIMPRTGELGHDLGRSQAGMVAYAGDWKDLVAAATIIAADGPASALHPARAAGKRIIYV